MDGSILSFRKVSDFQLVLCYDIRLASEFTPQNQLKHEAETIMHQLMTFVHFTAVRIFRDIWSCLTLPGWQFYSFFYLLCVQDLYHELHALDRFEQDYQRKIQEEENPSTVQRGRYGWYCHSVLLVTFLISVPFVLRCGRYPRYLENWIKESEEACKKPKEKITLVSDLRRGKGCKLINQLYVERVSRLIYDYWT